MSLSGASKIGSREDVERTGEMYSLNGHEDLTDFVLELREQGYRKVGDLVEDYQSFAELSEDNEIGSEVIEDFGVLPNLGYDRDIGCDLDDIEEDLDVLLERAPDYDIDDLPVGMLFGAYLSKFKPICFEGISQEEEIDVEGDYDGVLGDEGIETVLSDLEDTGGEEPDIGSALGSPY